MDLIIASGLVLRIDTLFLLHERCTRLESYKAIGTCLIKRENLIKSFVVKIIQPLFLTIWELSCGTEF